MSLFVLYSFQLKLFCIPYLCLRKKNKQVLLQRFAVKNNCYLYVNTLHTGIFKLPANSCSHITVIQLTAATVPAAAIAALKIQLSTQLNKPYKSNAVFCVSETNSPVPVEYQEKSN